MSIPTSRHPNSVQSTSQFFAAVRRVALREGPVPEFLRPVAVATTSSSEGVGSDGGHLVPPDFQTAVSAAILAENSLLSRCTIIETQRNSVTLPVDESPMYSASGIKPAVAAEGSSLSQMKMAVASRSIRLTKLSAFAAVSNELLEDSPGLEPYLIDVASRRFNFLINQHLLAGSGVDQILGFINQPCAVSIPAEGAQPTATVVLRNLERMYAALIPSYRSSACWIMHSSVEAVLASIVGQPGSVLLDYDNNGVAYLFGIPVVSTEAASAIGGVGDVTLVGLRGIIAAIKSGLIKRTLSVHVGFDSDRSAFRFDVRIAATPMLSAPVNQLNGGLQVSSVVSLAARP